MNSSKEYYFMKRLCSVFTKGRHTLRWCRKKKKKKSFKRVTLSGHTFDSTVFNPHGLSLVVNMDQTDWGMCLRWTNQKSAHSLTTEQTSSRLETNKK